MRVDLMYRADPSTPVTCRGFAMSNYENIQSIVMMRRASAVGRGIALAVLTLCAMGVSSAQAAITVDVTELKRYDSFGSDSKGPYLDVRVSGDATKDEIDLSLAGQLLKINGEDPAGTPTDFTHIVRLRVDAGPGGDSISMRGLRDYAGFINPDLAAGKANVFGGAGDDVILGFGTTDEDLAALGPNGSAATNKGTWWRFGMFGSLRGGGGNDLLLGSRGADNVFGGPGSDRIRAFDRPDLLHGGPGADRIWGGDNAWKREEIFGGAGNDVLFGGPGDDLMLGKQGSDRLVGGPGRDTMYQNTQSRRWPGGCDEAPPGLCWPIIE